MKLSFTILGYAKAQDRPAAVALPPKGGKALVKRAQEVLDFAGPTPLREADRQVVMDALNLRTRVHVYDRPADKDWKNTVMLFLIGNKVCQDPLWDGPVILEAIFYFPVPKSYPKRLHEAVARGERIPHITGKDTEQLIKPIKDACTGRVWTNDNRVYDEHVLVLYGSPPRVEVMLELEEGKR
jgi:Holliday junction resolvase RusA-like endonuclease